ncbi:alpha1 protein [Puchong virus]|uniref:Alpha1 protein n=1 Tax=Puchong virus TaxID=1272955 RepID=A0A7D0IV03_9RHAB|nr:alpha1 protein [Puchong virus]QEA08644.1 alpha1 protein [Puchong virus]
MDKPFRKLWEDIKRWGEDRGSEIQNWWGLLEWRLKIFGIIILLLVGSVVLYKIGKILFHCANCLYKGGKSIKGLTRRIRNRRKTILPKKLKTKRFAKHGGKAKILNLREDVHQEWEETKMY